MVWVTVGDFLNNMRTFSVSNFLSFHPWPYIISVNIFSKLTHIIIGAFLQMLPWWINFRCLYW